MEYVIEPEDLVKQLLASIEAAQLERATNKPWTKTIKIGLSSILQQGLTEVIFSDAERKTSEFLLDLVAWNRKDGEGIVLAMECEWSERTVDIVQDFEKLLVVKSATKLMIFASYGTGKVQDRMISALEKSLLSYKHHEPGERYIFVDFAPKPKRKAFWFQIPSKGKISSFTPIEIDLNS